MRAPRIPRFTRNAIPRSAGALSSTSHITGMNERKSKLTEGSGTNMKVFGGTSIKPPGKAPAFDSGADFFSIGFGMPGKPK